MGRKKKNKKPSGACDCWFDFRTGQRHRCKEHEVKPPEPPKKIYYSMSPKNLLEFGREIEDELARALFFFVYLTGCRISEATDFTLMRLNESPERAVIRLRTLKQRGRGNPMREISIPKGKVAKCHEEAMWAIVKGFLKGAKSPGDKLFKKWNCKSGVKVYLRRKIEIQLEADFRQQSGEYITRSLTKPFHPHYLRHCRATHLVEEYDFSDNQLCKFFGWSDPRMAQRYTQKADVWRAFLKHK